MNRCHIKIQQYIVSNFPMQNQQIDHDFTTLINHIKTGSAEQAEEMLRNAPDTLTNKLETQFRQPPLYFATLSNGDQASAELIKLLIRYGANVKYKDHNEQTILFYACREGKQTCTEILLSHGLSLDEIDVYGQTPLFYAISENRLQIVRKYATRERVNHVDKLVSQTPLYYAARRGHLDMCKLLLQKGADICHLDNSNKSAIEYAKKAKFNETAEFLNNELKRNKELSKGSSNSNVQPVAEQSSQKKRKDELSVKEAKQTYRIVFYKENGQSQDLTQDQVVQLINQHPQLQSILANPDSIPSEQLDSALESWNKVALKVLNQCAKFKGAYYFLNPVDPLKYNIIDYFDIIKTPMDLGTVRKKLQHNCYREAVEFISDMNLIWQNSYKYNGENHVVSKFAHELQEAFKEASTANSLDRFVKPQETKQ